MSRGLSSKWREALALAGRPQPDLYERSDSTSGPYAEAVSFALNELRLDGVLCIGGVPTIGFLDEPDVSFERINELHRILWNQGLMSLLLVMRPGELTAYSLVQVPERQEYKIGSDPRLIITLSLVKDALKLKELIYSAQSGRFWFEHEEYFDPENRVDRVLLSNLLHAFRDMRSDLGIEAAQALLMQTMFIAYLEDRQIITQEVFRETSQGACSSFADVLASGSTKPFENLFFWLKRAFNGNVFNAPCAFELEDRRPPTVKKSHLLILARFRHGREEMESGQLRLWGYDFRYLPIGLISAVYDRFLKEEADRRSADGAFYTPMFLADVVINQLWDDLTDEQRSSGSFFDPACGSGIFLVRLFQRLVAHHCRLKNKQRATWTELKSIASRLHGADINPSAVRVAAFSLYIALLEQLNPPDLQALMRRGKLLPRLYGNTLRPSADFFASNASTLFDAIVGNPPWRGRGGEVTTAQTFAKSEGYPDPAKDIAWSFVWKSLKVIKPTGLVALLVPAMGMLHNASRLSQEARKRLIKEARVKRIINLSDLCFQLFDGAKRPTAVLLCGRAKDDQAPYRFDYWVPKADLNLRLKRMLTLSRADRLELRSDSVQDDPAVFKRRLWTRGPDEKLIQYLKTIPPLSGFIQEYKDAKHSDSIGWTIGEGFKPAQEGRLAEQNYQVTTAPVVTRFTYLSADAFKTLALPHISGRPWSTTTVHRSGFEGGFSAPHILILQGVERSNPRVRAAYSEQNLVFEHSIRALSFPARDRSTAKLLTAVLNSSLAAWFYFHETANLGAERAKVLQSDLLRLPFDLPANMPNPERASQVAKQIVRLVDKAVERANELLQAQDDLLGEIDDLVFQYYGLESQEVALVEDAFNYIIRAMQPRRSAGILPLWTSCELNHRSQYAKLLCEALQPWFKQSVSAVLAAKSSDLSVLQLTIGSRRRQYSESDTKEFDSFLRGIAADFHQRLPGNFQYSPDLRLVIGRDLYLVKPMQLRHWLRSTALADAEQIAAEFNAAIARHTSEGRA